MSFQISVNLCQAYKRLLRFMTRTRLFLRKTLINIFYYRGPFESRPGNNTFYGLNVCNPSIHDQCVVQTFTDIIHRYDTLSLQSSVSSSNYIKFITHCLQKQLACIRSITNADHIVQTV